MNPLQYYHMRLMYYKCQREKYEAMLDLASSVEERGECRLEIDSCSEKWRKTYAIIRILESDDNTRKEMLYVKNLFKEE